MPLPQLDTGGIDITNTLRSISQEKTSRLNRETRRKQNALLDIQLSPEAQTRKTGTENAILKGRQLDNRNQQIQNRNNILSLAREGLADSMAKAEAGDEAAYPAYRDYMIGEWGLTEDDLISPDFFYDEKPDLKGAGGVTKIFNKERFMKWGKDNLKTADDIIAGKEGNYKQVKIYDPDGRSRFFSIDTTAPVVDAETVSGVKGSSFDKPGTVKTETPKATDVRADEKSLVSLDEKLTKIDKEGFSNLTDKAAGAGLAEGYNKVAERLGSKWRYEWQEDVIEVEKDPEGIVANLLNVPGAIGRAFTGEGSVEKVGGYVKVPVEEFGKKKIKTKEEIDKNLLEQYKIKYPDRSEEEIIKAIGRG